MVCPVCRQRKARRDCPALRTTICTICCGTKRLTEIPCPTDCVHLASAREHPAAMVKRQQERDVAAVLPTIRHLTERQQQLFFLFQSAIVRHVPDGFGRLNDDDVADATEAAAKTLETTAKGLIYDHPAHSQVAQRLAGELKALIEKIREQGTRVYDGEAAIALRAIEGGAREVRKALPDGGGEGGGAGRSTAYLDAVRRLLQANSAEPRAAEEAKPESRLILP